MTVAGADAFFGEQSFDEGEIGLTILETVGADRVVLGQVVPVLEDAGEGGVAGKMFVEQASDDLGDGLVLEDAAVAAVAEGGERGFESQDVLGKTAVGAILGGVGDEAAEQTRTAVGEQERDLGRLAQQAFEFEVGVGAQTVEGVAVADGQTFFADQAVGQEGL